MSSNEAMLTRIQEDHVKFLSLQFTDVTGVVKSVDIPAGRVEPAAGPDACVAIALPDEAIETVPVM